MSVAITGPDLNTETHRVSRKKKTEKTENESVLSLNRNDGCTDKKDDGNIGFWQGCKNIVIGAGKGIGNAVKSLAFDENGDFSMGRVLLSAGTIGLCIACPPVALGLCTLGAVKGIWEIGKGISNVMDAKTDAQTKAAFQHIGSGGVEAVASAAGAKVGWGAVKNTSTAAESGTSAVSALKEDASIGENVSAFLQDIGSSAYNTMIKPVSNKLEGVKQAYNYRKNNADMRKTQEQLKEETNALKEQLKDVPEENINLASAYTRKIEALEKQKANLADKDKDAIQDYRKAEKAIKSADKNKELSSMSKEALEDQKSQLSDEARAVVELEDEAAGIRTQLKDMTDEQITLASDYTNKMEVLDYKKLENEISDKEQDIIAIQKKLEKKEYDKLSDEDYALIEKYDNYNHQRAINNESYASLSDEAKTVLNLYNKAKTKAENTKNNVLHPIQSFKKGLENIKSVKVSELAGKVKSSTLDVIKTIKDKNYTQAVNEYGYDKVYQAIIEISALTVVSDKIGK